jgi:4-carboxymuconolactone decarboxylase
MNTEIDPSKNPTVERHVPKFLHELNSGGGKPLENPLYSDVWADPPSRPRDRSIATVAALIALYRPEVYSSRISRFTPASLRQSPRRRSLHGR